MRLFSYFMIVTCCLFNGLNAQSDMRQIIPPSPTAASLAEYADVPVGYYTGTPQIQIPIYTVKDKNLNMPISLSYNASGIKANQESSWVGLGWSLNAGGLITRQVRGLDDFDVAGGYINTSLPARSGYHLDTNPGSFTENYNKLISIFNQSQDAEPDIFYYNFAGKTGKFYFEKSNSGLSVYTATLEKDKGLTITYSWADGIWIIKDLDGTTYLFETNERTVFRSGASDFPVDDDYDSLSRGFSDKITTAWYLDEVKSRSGGLVVFKYDSNFVSKSQLNRNEKILRSLAFSEHSCSAIGSGCSFYSTPSLNSHYYRYDLSRVDTDLVYLKEIVFANGRVEFIKNIRDDILPKYPNNPNTFPQKLDGINVYNNQSSSPLLSYILDNDYFKNSQNETDARYLRLKLNGVQQIKENEALPPYSFEYYQDHLIPSKLTRNVDHWGYCNGTKNDLLPRWGTNSGNSGTMVPTLRFVSSTNQNNENFRGADREPDINYTTLFTLKNIAYPTRGKQTFEYELNEYRNLLVPYEIEVTDSVLVNAVTCNIDGPCTGYEAAWDEAFTVTPNVFPNSKDGKDITIAWSLYGSMPDDISDRIAPFIEIYDLNTGGSNPIYDKNYPGYDDFGSYPSGTDLSGLGADDEIFLEPGDYRITVTPAPGMEAYVFVIAEDIISTPVVKKKGAGLRLKKSFIETDPNNSESSRQKIKTYRYSSDSLKTSGILMSHPYYFSTVGIGEIIVGGISTCIGSCTFSGSYVFASSDSQVQLGNSANGSYIGYSMVEESLGEHGEFGKTKYYFYNTPDDVYEYLLGAPNYPRLENGLLSKVEHYNKSNSKVKQTEYRYSPDYQSEGHIEGFYTKSVSSLGNLGQSPNNYNFWFMFYDMPVNNWWKLDSEITTQYYPNISSEIVAKTNFIRYNEDNKLPEKITHTDSKGQIVETEKFYSTSYSSGHSAYGSNLLRNNHMLSQVLEEDTKYSGINLKKETTSYGNVGTANGLSLILPVLQSQIPKNFFQDAIDISYNYENNTGNPKEIIRTDAPLVSYIWGYNSQYPVLKAENADHGTVVSAVTGSLPGSFSNLDGLLESLTEIQGKPAQQADWELFNKDLRAVLPEAMITTYTYNPMIGVTSMTDPRGYTIYYEYDAFNRLEEVRDAEGNLVTDYKYHFQTEDSQ